MPFTNSTPNYGLPQYIATDKPTYLGDTNSAYSTIDTRMKANANAAAKNENDISLLSARVMANETSTSVNTGSIATLNSAIEGWTVSQITPATAFSTSPAVYFSSNKKLGLMGFDGYLTKGSANILANDTLFVLPEGHRPAATQYYRGGVIGVGTSTSAMVTITIAPTGIVAVYGITPLFGAGNITSLFLELDIHTAGWGTGFPPVTTI